MYRDVTQWTRIRRRVLTGGVSQKRIAQETGISRVTVRKMVEFPIPPGYRRKTPIDRSKLRLCSGLIDGIVKEDQGQPKQQQHTIRQIWEWLKREHGFTGGYTIVKDYVRGRRMVSASTSGPTPLAFSQDAFEAEDPAALIYELLQSVRQKEAIRLLRLLLGGGKSQIDMERLNRLLEPFAIKETRGARRLSAKQTAFEWMRKVLQGEVSPQALAGELSEISDLNELVTVVTEGRLSDRNRALTVLARKKGVSIADVCEFLDLAKASVLKYCRRYREGGAELLMAGKIVATAKFDKESNKQAVFSLLHTPPSVYGVNRTTWRMADLEAVLRRQGSPLCKDVIRTIFKEAGYKWRSARVVLTSRDPEYRTKVEAIKKLLSELGEDEAFFSIDEYGPFAVKKKGGIKRVAPGQEYVVPQWQKSKGWMILTAALELSRNQVTHFYSRAKNTDEMIRMADLLRAQYHACRTIYLSWDAASWHISKKLLAHPRWTPESRPYVDTSKPANEPDQDKVFIPRRSRFLQSIYRDRSSSGLY